MTRKKPFVLAMIFSIVSVLALGSSVLAHEDAPVSSDTPATGVDRRPTVEQKNRIEERKAELKKQVESHKETRQNSLENKRLLTCEGRQTKINSILTKGTEQSRKHLAIFQKIEDKVKQFYIDKALAVEGYEAALTAADTKEALAIAAIETSAETSFDCANTDGAKPGVAQKELMKTRHDALKEYRTAIKDLIVLVKKGNAAHQDAEAKPETEAGEQ